MLIFAAFNNKPLAIFPKSWQERVFFLFQEMTTSGKKMKDIVIAAFYKFVQLDDFEALREPFLRKMQHLGLRGTLILAQEGINGSFAGSRQQVSDYYQFLFSDSRFKDLQFRETFDDKNPFEKAKVKLRKEIVTMGIKEVDPHALVGEYLSPDEWDELLQEPDVVVVDTRNHYEYELGTFRKAINPETENFRDFPQYTEEHLLDKKDKKIAMFCTGGIRCEKSTAYLKSQGFEKVYHLQGGILNYLQARKNNEDSLWQGYCFVFDNRVAIDRQLNRVYPQLPED